MNERLEALRSASAGDRTVHRPVLFRLGHAEDRLALEDLLKLNAPAIRVHDELHGQLRELVRTLNPTVRFSPGELDEAARAHLGATPHAEYGVWVYYPWSGRLVHLLDEEEFARVRTDRNRNKITLEEQALLATKRVGVIGLSVGQSVSLTMALERSFGEIRLADFDTLELSNLNRIRSGAHNLGIPKTVNVAREIAEIDPFLSVTCFHEGITRENIDRFLTDGGKLDVVVEECDSVDVKIYARLKAKALGIPVLMDTSDRGLIDVERFDLEPDRPLIHGRLSHIDLDSVNDAMPPSERLEAMLHMVDKDNLSPRMKASFPEIGRSLLTWPQLGSHVIKGGAMAADLWRRLATGTHRCSGRWYVDLEEVLSPERSTLNDH